MRLSWLRSLELYSFKSRIILGINNPTGRPRGDCHRLGDRAHTRSLVLRSGRLAEGKTNRLTFLRFWTLTLEFEGQSEHLAERSEALRCCQPQGTIGFYTHASTREPVIA